MRFCHHLSNQLEVLLVMNDKLELKENNKVLQKVNSYYYRQVALALVVDRKVSALPAEE